MSSSRRQKRRPPDRVIQETIFVPPPPQDEDWELYETIRQSREEHLAEQQRLQEATKRREELRAELAMPLSRLRTWCQYSREEDEQLLLQNMIRMVEAYLNGEEYLVEDATLQEQLRLFVSQHMSSPLFQKLGELCLQLLHV